MDVTRLAIARTAPACRAMGLWQWAGDPREEATLGLRAPGREGKSDVFSARLVRTIGAWKPRTSRGRAGGRVGGGTRRIAFCLCIGKCTGLRNLPFRSWGLGVWAAWGGGCWGLGVMFEV